MLLCRVCCLLALGLLVSAWVVFGCGLVGLNSVAAAWGVGGCVASLLLIVLF